MVVYTSSWFLKYTVPFTKKASSSQQKQLFCKIFYTKQYSHIKNMSTTGGKQIRVIENIIKSGQDPRLYRGLQLQNEMKVLLVSDPTTDKSAAALHVHIGHMSDPVHLPGLAHFCEHMLFLGTEKYPVENEYTKFLSQHGGSSNAFTAPDHATYYFDVSPQFLYPALDRFSQFFLCPLFTASATEREVNAVHSEHEKNLKNDVWRLHQLEKSTSNPHHDYSKFATGNLETLDSVPKSKGIDVRQELLEFHEKFYSSNIMSLVVLGKETLDSLSDMVTTLFSDVKNKNVTLPEWNEHPFDKDHLKLQGYVVPVRDIRNLYVTFPIPDLQKHYKSNPGHYVGHLLGHEGPGSLLSELKTRGWVNNLVGGYKRGATGFAFCVMDVDLTEEGIENTDDIILLMFQYLNMLKDTGPKEMIFEECQKLAEMQFKFKDRERPLLYACNLAGLLHDYPFEDVLCGPYLLQEYKPELITQLLECLIPDNIRIAVIGKKFESLADAVEKWYGTKYKLEPVKEEIINAWKNAGFHDNLKLPMKNEFIPSNFDLLPREPNCNKFPVLIKNTEMTRLWFKQDDEFLLPKAVLNFELQSPLAYLDPYHYNVLYLFIQLFKDALNEYTYAAELAGLSYSLNITKCGMFLQVKGYNDKQPVLLQKILDKLTTFHVDSKRFDILKESYIRSLKNFNAEQPHQHAVYYTSLLLSERVWSNVELLNRVDELTPDGVHQIIPQLLSRIHIEALMYGNISKEQSEAAVEIVESKLKENIHSQPLFPSQMHRDREYQLSEGCHYVFETTNEVHRCSSIETYYQCGIQETRANILIELFCQIITEPCYNMLRTQEQLGYIVCSGVRRANGVQGVRIMVQSDKSPSYVDSRIEAFLQVIDKLLLDLSDEEFESHKQALATQRLEKPKKLGMQAAKYWKEIMLQQYNFDRDNIEVACLKSITKDDVYALFKELISFDAPKRKKLSVHIVPSISDKSTELVDDSCNDAEIIPKEIDGLIPPPPAFRPPLKIENILEFKSSLGLYPLAKPSINIPAPVILNHTSKSKL